MAEIIQNEGGGHKKGKRRPKKHSTHIDMTPMVDLACLLLTFFMLTTAFSKPKVMEIVLPEKNQKDINKEKIPKSRVVTILMDENDKVYYYKGMMEKPPYPELIETNYSKDGIRKMILNRNKKLFAQIDSVNNDAQKSKKATIADTLKKKIKAIKRLDKSGPIVLIKATDKAKYKNIVDVIDEMAICNVAIYSIVDLNKPEIKLLEEKKKGLTGDTNPKK
jgi:biopolymer transport protein ExbD